MALPTWWRRAPTFARWKRYAEGVLGMMTATAPGDGLYVKMDERQYRMLVLPGARDAYLASGWEVLDRAAFEAGLGVLKAQGVAFELADASLCDQRRVQQLAAFRTLGQPARAGLGLPVRLRPFRLPAGVKRFVTGAIGMGTPCCQRPSSRPRRASRAR